MSGSAHASKRGQTLVLFALSLIALLLLVGLVVDGGYALSQRRAAQNAADFAALAGTRIVGEALTGKPAGAGTDTNVNNAVLSVLAANQGQLVSAKYVDSTGAVIGTVGSGSIPSGAQGVVVNANTTWRPYFLGLIGVTNWSAGASAAAISPGIASAGVMPVGIQNSAFNALPLCTHPEDVSLCDSSHLTPGTLNLPGGFGWLKFGAVGKCAGYGLGMTLDGCEENRGFLQSEIGPPANSHGCCTDVTLTPDSARRIGSAPGNKPGDLTFYVQHQVVVWVPIWDYADLTGANGYYHIVGFGAIIFDGQDVQHGKWLTGVRVSGIGNTPNASQLGATGKVELIR